MLNLLVHHVTTRLYKVKVYRTIISSVVLYGVETLSLTFRNDRRLRLFENRMLRRIFEHKRPKSGENYIMRSLLICNLHQMLFG
jgi:hypothetical protein